MSWTDGRPPDYKEKWLALQRKRRAANPEKYREITRRSERKRKLRRYGLTEVTYRELLDSQNGVCGICENENTYAHDWHVDHNHKTGETRGLLCHGCNLLLGQAKDSILVLEKAIEYLKVHNGR